MRWIFTDKDRWCDEESKLSEEGGWWFPDGRIFVWMPGNSRIQRFGIAIHETSEYIMVHKFGFNANVAHNLANILEIIATLGNAKDQYWGISKIRGKE